MSFPFQLTIFTLAFLVIHRAWASLETKPVKVLPPAGSTAAGALRASQKSHWTRHRLSLAVSAFVLLATLYVVVSHDYGQAQQKWAYAAVGAILGFWLKPDE